MAESKTKKIASAPKKPQKVFYEIVVDTLVPMKVKYRVWAESPQEAAELVKKGRVPIYSMPKPFVRFDRIKALVVYLAGTVNRVFSCK